MQAPDPKAQCPLPDPETEKLKISDPRRADHLVPYRWQQGESGNPLGKSKGEVNITSRLKRELLKDLPNSKTDSCKADMVVAALVAEAREGNVQAINIILDRLEGKVTDKVEVSGQAVVFNIVEAKNPND